MTDFARETQITGHTIRLGQFLKLADLASSGGEAKLLLAGGLVRVNGEPAEKRGRSLHPGDIVDCEGRGSARVT